MKKIAFLFMVLICSGYSANITPFTYYHAWRLTGDTVTAPRLKYNDDSVSNFSIRASNAVNLKAPWLNLLRGDSLFKKIKVDTIRSNPNIDSICGAPFIDTVKANKLTVSDSVLCANFKASDSAIANNIKATGNLNVGGGVGVTYNLISDSVIANGARIAHTVLAESANVAKCTKAPRGIFDSIKIGTGDWLKTSGRYGSFLMTITKPGGGTQFSDSVYYQTFNGVVALSIPFGGKIDTVLDDESHAFNSDVLTVSALPSYLIPATSKTIYMPISFTAVGAIYFDGVETMNCYYTIPNSATTGTITRNFKTSGTGSNGALGYWSAKNAFISYSLN